MAWLLHADVNRDMEQLVESTKIVPTCKKKRKSKVKENKGIVKYMASNHSHENVQGTIQEKIEVGGGIETHSRKRLVEEVFANQ